MAEVEIYTWATCPYCVRAKGLLDQKGAKYREYDAADPVTKAEMVERAGGRTSVPQIFIDGAHIGGCDDLHALEAQGKLDGLLYGSKAKNSLRPA